MSLSGPAGANGWYVGPVTVTLAASDPEPGSGVASTHFSLDGGALQTYTGSFTVSTDAVHRVDFYSTDNAGNVEATQSQTIKLDQTPTTTTATRSARPGITVGTSGR